MDSLVNDLNNFSLKKSCIDLNDEYSILCYYLFQYDNNTHQFIIDSRIRYIKYLDYNLFPQLHQQLLFIINNTDTIPNNEDYFCFICPTIDEIDCLIYDLFTQLLQ
jgi:hypothetical protein